MLLRMVYAAAVDGVCCMLLLLRMVYVVCCCVQGGMLYAAAADGVCCMLLMLLCLHWDHLVVDLLTFSVNRLRSPRSISRKRKPPS